MIVCDIVFFFVYLYFLDYWYCNGVELLFFLLLVDEVLMGDCDVIYMFGGYFEFYVGMFVVVWYFKFVFCLVLEFGKFVYGECGGYMVLGDGLVDVSGLCYVMFGLLFLEMFYY